MLSCLNWLRQGEVNTVQTVTHKGATYTVTAHYSGNVSFPELLKLLVKRDIGKLYEKQ
jgi:hypothetical protein